MRIWKVGSSRRSEIANRGAGEEGPMFGPIAGQRGGREVVVHSAECIGHWGNKNDR
jgi:hypothetical protein